MVHKIQWFGEDDGFVDSVWLGLLNCEKKKFIFVLKLKE